MVSEINPPGECVLPGAMDFGSPCEEDTFSPKTTC